MPRLLRCVDDRPRLSVAFGGGGPFGIAYGMGVVDALTREGVDVAGAEAVGTSAGAWVAACVATGVAFADLCQVPQLRIPNPRPGLLTGLTREFFGDRTSPAVTASAVRLATGRRSMLGGDEHRLADIVAASSAVPGVFAPVRVDGRWYVDGGVRSLVSADRAAPAEHLLVVAPIAGPMFGPAGRALELLLRAELHRWQNTTGGKAHLVRPNAAVAALARTPLHLFDKRRAQAVYPLAQRQALDLLRTRSGLAALTSVRAAA
jgi:NTE family protein